MCIVNRYLVDATPLTAVDLKSTSNYQIALQFIYLQKVGDIIEFACFSEKIRFDFKSELPA